MAVRTYRSYINDKALNLNLCFNFTVGQFLLVGWFGFHGPLRQYFSLYRAVSLREGERGEKG